MDSRSEAGSSEWTPDTQYRKARKVRPHMHIEYDGEYYGRPDRGVLSIPYEDIKLLKAAHDFLECCDEDNDPPDDPMFANCRAHLRRFWDALWDIIPPLKHTSKESSVKAQEVFSTTELLEEILSYLNTKDKLEAMKVQRTWRDTVLGSVILRRALGLESYDDGIYYSALSNRFQGLSYGLTREAHGLDCAGFVYDDSDPRSFRWDEDSHYSWWTANHQPVCENPELLRVVLTVSPDPKHLQFGSRVAAMRVMDPPVKAMTVLLDCRCPPYSLENENHGDQDEDLLRVTSSSEHGFTIGDIAKWTLAIAAEHTDCDLTQVRYEAEIQLHGHDIVMKQRREAEKEAAVLREERRARWLEADARREAEIQERYGPGPAEVPEGYTEADYEQELRLAALDEQERQREQEDGMEMLGSESDIGPVLGGVSYVSSDEDAEEIHVREGTDPR